MPRLGLGLGLDLQYQRTVSAPFVGPLDAYTSNLAVVLSVTERLLSSYTGNLITVRRSIGSPSEADFSYKSDGTIDSDAILAFCGSGDGFVRRIYRQDGSSSHAEETSAANQPRIVNAGILDDGYQCNGIMHLSIASSSYSNYSDGTNCQVLVECNPTTVAAPMFDFSSGGNQITGYPAFIDGNTYWDSPDSGARLSGATPVGIVGNYGLHSYERAGSATRLRFNGSIVLSGSASNSISGNSNFAIGSNAGFGVNWVGAMRNFIIWKDCVNPAARAAALS